MSEVPRHMRSHCELIREIEELREMNRKLANHNHDYSMEIAELKDALELCGELETASDKEVAELKKTIQHRMDDNCEYDFDNKKLREQLAEAREVIAWYSYSSKAKKYLEKYPSEEK